MKNYYKHAVTGQVAQYPDAVAALFSDLIPVDDAGECIKCKIDTTPTEVDEVAEVEINELFVGDKDLRVELMEDNDE